MTCFIPDNWPRRFGYVALFCVTTFIGSKFCRAESPDVSVGVAKVDITPTVPVVLAGYGNRTREYEGIDTQLWARVLVIGDQQPVAIVAIDNCGVTRRITGRLAERLAEHGIQQERLVVAATHTHNAPNLAGYAPVLWKGRTTPQQDKLTAEYTTFVVSQMEKAVVNALADRRPMRLEWAQGRVSFGGNRRVLNGSRWAGFGFQRNGPVDHSLPVLVARDAEGEVQAVWTNYACHCTTVGSRNHVGGDWAGYANEWIEKQFPGAVSLVTIGCGADIGPQPGGTLQIAEQHGRTLAAEVERLLSSERETTQLASGPRVTTRQIELPLADPKSREHWQRQLTTQGFSHQLARLTLERLDQTGAIPSKVQYPVSAWTFGDDLAIVFLAGEVVVDYSVRLNRELDWSRLWIVAWANDMPGYIPSRRVLAEGGYEADFSQVYYGQPSRYDPKVEDVLVTAVRQAVGDRFAARPDQEPAPFHRIPSGEPAAFDRAAAWAQSEKPAEQQLVLDKLRQYVRLARPAIERVAPGDSQEAEWHNFAGDFVRRRFIRQTARGTQLQWTSPVVADDLEQPLVLCFIGGVGWQSQPKTGGFALLLNDSERLRFDVTLEASRWTSADETVELIYLPTWTSNEDSGGFFFLAWSQAETNDDDRVAVTVRSRSEGSQRWFAIETRQDISLRLKKLADALGR